MENDITQNPDYRLVMTFLQNIRPGDMDQESAEQLMAIGQRIQNGGILTEREREMLNSVVRAMPEMPMGMETGAVRDGAKFKDNFPMRNQTGAVSDADLRLLKSQGLLPNTGFLPSQDGETYGPSSGVTIMDMQKMIDAGIINPNRPRPRPENLGQMRPRPRPASME